MLFRSGAFATGRIAELASRRKIITGTNGRDQIKLRFAANADLDQGDLEAFLREHLDAVRGASVGG